VLRKLLRDFTLQQAIEGKLALDESFRARPAYAERTRSSPAEPVLR